MKDNIAIIFCVEEGILETQSKLLVESIAKFPPNNDYKLIGVSPRTNSMPGIDTECFFQKHNVSHIKENLNRDFLDYPIANKILACEYVEKTFPEYNSIMFVDTDSLFLNPIDKDSINSKNTLLLRPVDNKGPGSLGREDENDSFWQEVFKLFNLEVPKADLITTVRQKTIRPYFNAGFIWANHLPGFFSQWKGDFIKIVNSGLRPFGYRSRDNTDFRCLDQVALAITAQRFKANLKLLDETFNYPIPFRPIINERPKHPKFDELVHIHYHKWFQHPLFLDHVISGEDKKTEQYIWLKKHVPIQPIIQDSFKC